jgi:hypothetical protein
VSTLYYAPTYFSPYYFTPLAASQGAGPGNPPPTVYNDRTAYEAILALLKATQAFDCVLFACSPDRQALGPSGASLASLMPSGWEEFDEVDPTAILRRVSFSLILLTRDSDPLLRFELLNRLEAIVHDALEGSNLGGGCLPALTRLWRGRYDQQSLHPEQSVRLDGEFTYILGSTVLPATS